MAARSARRLDCKHAVAGANVLIVDDIVDNGPHAGVPSSVTGGSARPASLRSCALFDKPGAPRGDVPVDYAGIAVPDVFVIGYGLDYKEEYRNLPYLAELREEKAV